MQEAQIFRPGLESIPPADMSLSLHAMTSLERRSPLNTIVRVYHTLTGSLSSLLMGITTSHRPIRALELEAL